MTKTDVPDSRNDVQPMPLQKNGISKTMFGVTIAIVLAVGVAIGMRSDEVIASLPFVNAVHQKSPATLNLSSVEKTYRLLRQNFDGRLDANKLIEGANRGLVEAAGDPYTTFFSKKEADEFMNDLEGTFSGIGAELGMKDDKLIVVTTLDDSPAKKAGLKKDDIIAKVNDSVTTGWSVDKAVSQIRGEKGTTVKLTVLRDQEVKDISITRDTITDPSVKAEVKNGIGILRISRFSEVETLALAKKAAKDFKERGVKGVVVDLRGNGGGYLNAAKDIAELWLEKGKVIVSERTDGKVMDELRAEGNPVLKGIPTAVLIDSGSASASEILAGALKDNGAAKLVGEQTYGKGSVQQILDLPNGAQLKVTIAKWYTPSGKNINKEGIAPDVKIGYSAKDAKAGKDPQKDKAIELVAH